MNRREFILRSAGAITLLAGSGVTSTLTACEYDSTTKEGIRMRFAVASDGHYGQPQTSFDTFHREMINWLNDEHDRHPLDFVVFNGDLIHDDPGLLPLVKEHYDWLKVPYHVSRGNHDHCDETLWQSTWRRNFNYSFELKDTAFIILDTSNEKGEYICPDQEFVKQLFDRHSNVANLLVFMHITPVKWTGASINCRKLTDLFGSQENLRAVFHGHDHDEDSIKTLDGKNYFFDSHIGGNWGTDYRGYRVVEITEKNSIITYQMNPMQTRQVNRNRF